MLGPGSSVGDYVVDSPLEGDRLTELFSAHHRGTGARVFIRKGRHDMAGDETARTFFVEAIRLASSGDHPGLVRVRSVGRADGDPLVVTEDDGGERLSAYLVRRGERVGEVAFALNLGISLATTLAGVHNASSFHGWLSAGHVWLPAAESAGAPAIPRIDGLGWVFWARKDSVQVREIPPHLRDDWGGPTADVFAIASLVDQALHGPGQDPFGRDRDRPVAPVDTPAPELAALLSELRESSNATKWRLEPLAMRLREIAGRLGIAVEDTRPVRPPPEPVVFGIAPASAPRSVPSRNPASHGRPRDQASSIPAAAPAPAAPARAYAPTPTPTPAEVKVDENVQFTVRRPRVVAPNRWAKLMVFAHLAEKRPDAPADEPDPLEEVERQTRQILGRPEDHPATTADSTSAIPERGELTIVPVVEGIEFNPKSVSFRWVRPVHGFGFDFRAAAAMDGHTARGAVHVFLGSLVVAEIALAVAVNAQRAAAAQPDVDAGASDSARPYRKIFASYSHKDRSIVDEFRAYAHALGDRYLVDCVDLRAGEVWSDAIANLIKQADVFQLFWSRNSMVSPFVRQEWEYALALGGQNRIRPTYWEHPMPEAPGLPPPELKRLHFHHFATTGSPAAVPEPATPTVSAGALSDDPLDAGARESTARQMPAVVHDDPPANSADVPARTRPRWRAPTLVAVTSMLAVVFVFWNARFSAERGTTGPPAASELDRPKSPPRVDVDPPRPPTVVPRVEPDTVRIVLENVPRGATVLLDGKRAELPLVLPRGPTRHEISVASPSGGKPWIARVDATEDQTLMIERRRARATGSAATGARRSHGAVAAPDRDRLIAPLDL